MWIRMFLHEHLWIQLLLALTILPSPHCFCLPPTNKGKQGSILMWLFWVSVIIYSCLWHQVMWYLSTSSSNSVLFQRFVFKCLKHLKQASGDHGDKWLSWDFCFVEHRFRCSCHDKKRTCGCLQGVSFPHFSPRPLRTVFTSAVTCHCSSSSSQNKIQRPFVPISFSYQAKCSLETGLITWHDSQSS